MGDKLKVINSKELVKLLLSRGFIISRQKGSHIILYRENDRRTTVIPMHNKDIGTGLLRRILGECGITPDELK